jgi:hypothetical protein
VALVVMLGACRFGFTSIAKVDVWTPGQGALVLPMRGNTIDAQVAAVVAERLRELGDVQVRTPGPSADANGDEHHACDQALVMGADYVVLTSAEISVLDNTFCMVGTGILSRIVLPLPIPIPIPFTKRVEVVEIPLTVPDRCIFSVEVGDKWSISATARVFKAATCSPTGGELVIERGTNLTLHDGAALQGELVKKTADLFPARATIARMDGERAVVVAPKGMQTGQVFAVRKDADASDSLAYVRHVDTNEAVLEPYAPGDKLRPNDLLLRVGTPTWAEFSAYGATSQISIGGDRHLASGAGALFRVQLGSYLIGITAEYLRILDGDVRRATATTSTMKGGLQGGLHHHVSTRVDAYALLELGLMDTLGVTEQNDDHRAAYAAVFAGARLAIGKWFAGLEVGGVYSAIQAWPDHESVGQRGVAVRFTLGRNFRLGPALKPDNPVRVDVDVSE